MLIGIDMIAIQSEDDPSRESARLGRVLVQALLALDTTHRYLLYTHDGLPTGPISPSKNALRVSLPEGPGGPKASLQRILDHNPDGLEWMVLLDPIDPNYDGMPAETPLNGLKIASLIADLSPGLVDDRRLAKLRRHDTILVPSEATEIECRRRFSTNSPTVRRIGLACGDHFTTPDSSEPMGMGPGEELGRMGIIGPFLLANMGAGAGRANLAGILDAYRLLPPELRLGHQLVVTDAIEDPWAAIAFLHDHGCADGLVLLGPVGGSSLATLYARCSAFVAPAFDEGSALPWVEAMSCGAPVVGGSSETQSRLLDGAGLLADPFEPEEIARQIARILGDADLARDLRAKSSTRSEDFSREDMAREFLAALSDEPGRATARYRFDLAHQDRPRIAIFAGSSPRIQSGPDLDEILPRACRQLYDVDIYFDSNEAARLERLTLDYGGFHSSQFERHDEILDYHATVSIVADVFSLKSKLVRLRSRPALVFLLDETSLGRIGLESPGSDETSIDLEAELATYRLRELFLTGSRLAVRSTRDLEAVRMTLPAFADQVTKIPADRGHLLILEDLAEQIDRCAAELPRGEGRPSGRYRSSSPSLHESPRISGSLTDLENHVIRTG